MDSKGDPLEVLSDTIVSASLMPFTKFPLEKAKGLIFSTLYYIFIGMQSFISDPLTEFNAYYKLFEERKSKVLH